MTWYAWVALVWAGVIVFAIGVALALLIRSCYVYEKDRRERWGG